MSSIDTLADSLSKGLDRAKQLGAAAAKVTCRRSEELGYGFENARLKKAASQQALLYTIDVVVDGRRGATQGNRVEDVDELTERAVTLAKVGSVAHFDDYPAPAETASVQTWSDKTANLERDTMIEGCQRIIDVLKQHDPELFIEAGAGRTLAEGLLMTTSGVFHRRRTSGWSLGGHVQRTEGTDMLFAGHARSWRDLNDLYDPDFSAEEILTDLRRAEQIAESPEGQVTTIAAPPFFSGLLRAVLLGINGRNVVKGDSPLRDRLGEQVLDPAITIIDNPHMDFRPGAAEIDADGVPTQRIEIVTAGVLNQFLYDLDTAGLAGTQPTGNNGCSPHAIEVPGGEWTSEELIGSVDDGLLIKGVLGFGQSNLINGDFSCNVGLGFRIKGGKIVGRVKNTMIAGNVYDLLKTGVQLSSDRDPVNQLPHALLEGLSVSAAEN